MLKSTLTRLRETRTVKATEAADAGFTLIELMVVLLIIAILLAIAIPTFLGVSGSANDRASQSNLTNALTEVKALYQNNQSYAAASMPQAQLTASAPEFIWDYTAAIAGTGKGTNQVSINPVDVAAPAQGDGVVLASWAKGTNNCWYVVDLESAPSATAFVGGDPSPGTQQFLSATSGTNGEENLTGSAGLSTAGVYYAEKPNASSCNAALPTTAGPWKWGTSYSSAGQN